MSRLHHHLLQLMCSLLIYAELVSGNTGGDDMAVLIQLKAFLRAHNQINRGAYDGWPEASPSPCGSWRGVGCDADGRVSSLDLSSSSISGPLFGNFSGLSGLVRLDLSDNSIAGELPADLDRCVGLQHLNLSYNLISGALGVPSLTKLRTLDVSRNRLEGKVVVVSGNFNFLGACDDLVVLNVSGNSLGGDIAGLLGNCPRLRYVDLSMNGFTGRVTQSLGIASLAQFSAAENRLSGTVPPGVFPEGCGLQSLDLSGNQWRTQNKILGGANSVKDKSLD